MERRPLVLYTIGHSNQTMERFLDLLGQHGIEAIADVRSSPYCRYATHFSKHSLKPELRERGIAYVFLGHELGARREEEECYREGKVEFERVAATPAFQKGLARLLKGASKMTVAVLCAEKDPLTCHRAILIARHASGLVSNIRHILPDGSIETHAEAEQRLLAECKLQEPDLFMSREERLLEAYRRRAGHLAHEDIEPDD